MPSTQHVFAEEPNPQSEQRAVKRDKPKGPACVRMPNRAQVELRASDLESVLPPGHRARIVWGFVAGQNLAGPSFA